MLLNEIRKLQQLNDIIKEFEKEVAEYSAQWPNFTKDIEQLEKGLAFFKNGKYKDAYKVLSMADTIVREVVPNDVWEIIDSAYYAK